MKRYLALIAAAWVAVAATAVPEQAGACAVCEGAPSETVGLELVSVTIDGVEQDHAAYADVLVDLRASIGESGPGVILEAFDDEGLAFQEAYDAN